MTSATETFRERRPGERLGRGLRDRSADGNEDQTTRLDGDLIDPNSRRKDVEEAFSKAFEVIRETGYERGAETLTGKLSNELMAKHFGPPGARRRVTSDTMPSFQRDLLDEIAKIEGRQTSTRADPELQRKLNERGKQKKAE